MRLAMMPPLNRIFGCRNHLRRSAGAALKYWHYEAFRMLVSNSNIKVNAHLSENLSILSVLQESKKTFK